MIPGAATCSNSIDTGLGAWAAAHGTVLRLLVRPGDYVFPGAAIAVATPAVDGAAAAIRSATAVGGQRVSAGDIEFAVRQLVEVGVRALSPGINDPHTAMSVLDRLGAALCDAAPLHLSKGVTMHDGRPVLVVPAIDYGGLVDAMFHMLRQNAAGSTAVLAHQLDVLTAVAGCERDADRLAELGASCRPGLGRRRARCGHAGRPGRRARSPSPVYGRPPARAVGRVARRWAALRWVCASMRFGGWRSASKRLPRPVGVKSPKV